jgi:hypothetical protein
MTDFWSNVDYRHEKGHGMRLYQSLVRAVFGIVGVALMAVAVGLIVYAGTQLVTAFRAPDGNVGQSLLDCVGYAVIAIAVFDVAKYILEEEVINPTEMRDTGQARRSNTKFISIISIAVFLEALVAIFQTSKGPDVSMMLYPTLLLLFIFTEVAQRKALRVGRS